MTDKLNRIYQDEQIVTSILGNLRKKGKTKNQIHFDLCADAILAGLEFLFLIISKYRNYERIQTWMPTRKEKLFQINYFHPIKRIN